MNPWIRPALYTALLFAIGLLGTGKSAHTAEFPPRNPFLADSSYPLGHGDSAQQDALLIPGPQNPGANFEPNEIQYAHVGPAHFGA